MPSMYFQLSARSNISCWWATLFLSSLASSTNGKFRQGTLSLLEYINFPRRLSCCRNMPSSLSCFNTFSRIENAKRRTKQWEVFRSPWDAPIPASPPGAFKRAWSMAWKDLTLSHSSWTCCLIVGSRIMLLSIANYCGVKLLQIMPPSINRNCLLRVISSRWVYNQANGC